MRIALKPTVTVEGHFARRSSPVGAVGPDTSIPISAFVPPSKLGPLMHLAGTLRESWRAMLTAAVSRGQLPDRGEATALLELIARELCGEPAFGTALQPPLQSAELQFPIDRLAIYGDRMPAKLTVPPIRVVIAPPGPQLADYARVLSALTAGVDEAQLPALLTHPDLAKLVEALRFADLLVRAPAPPPRMLADGTVMHLGHATLLANLGGAHVLIDPWLPPASAGEPNPPLAIALLPPLAGIFFTHHHWDHVHPDTLLRLPKHVPLYIPAQDLAAPLAPHTAALLAYLGFTSITTVVPGDAIAVGEGGSVVAAPFYGEDPTRLGFRGCCYVLRHGAGAALVHVDSSTDVTGRSLASTGDAAALVVQFGPLDPVFATRRQEKGLAIDHTWDFVLLPSSTWLAPTENCCNDAAALAALVTATRCKQLVLYSEGGADWYPDGTDFLRRATPTARMAPHEYLWDSLATITAAIEAAGAQIVLSAPGAEFALGR